MSLTTALPLALTAYEGGVLFGRALPFVLGAALLAAGLVRRSRSATPSPTYAGWGAPATPAPPATAEQTDAAPSGWMAPTTPPSREGKGLIIAGSVLLAVGVLSVLAAVGERAQEVAERETADSGVSSDGAPTETAAPEATAPEATAPEVKRSIAFPDQIVGLPRDAALSEQAQAGASGAGGLPPGAQLAAYTDQQQVLLVIAAAGPNIDPEAEIAGYREGLEATNGPIGEGTQVDPGPLGGTARCWSTSFEGTPGATCVFVDGGSLLSTIDLGTTDVNEAGERGRQARAGTIQAQ